MTLQMIVLEVGFLAQIFPLFSVGLAKIAPVGELYFKNMSFLAYCPYNSRVF